MPSTSEPVAALESAAADLAEARAAIDDRSALEDLAEAVADVEDLLETYVDRATGTGGENFQAYVRFRDEIDTYVERLPDDLPERGAIERAQSTVDKRRLSESDFAAAREALEPARDRIAVLEDLDDARRRYREARSAVRRELNDLADDIADRERLRELSDADLDADVSPLAEPVEAYNEAIAADVADYRASTPARAVLAFLDEAAGRPMVELRAPPEDLLSYVREYEAGTEPIPQLLEYADYSRSKLDHYVENPDALKRSVATRQTYLERVDAEPFTVAWPPPPADRLRIRCDELLSVVASVAGEAAIERLRELQDLARDADRYGRLREAAVARAELSAAERERLLAGDVADELEELRAERDRLETALEEHPER